MRIAVTGATGVMGTSAVSALVAAGHDVIGMARTPQKAEAIKVLGASAAVATLFDQASLVAMFDGCDAVCNFATHIPVGLSAAWPRSWRENDRLRTEGVRGVVAAARAARVRRLVQESVSFIYAAQGDSWITEASPLDINRATEPASVGESQVADYQSGPRHGVVLRFGTIIGDDPMTRWMLKAAARSRPIGMGSPDSWAHVVHSSDIGGAVVAALSAPSGTYNVGAEPVRRRDLMNAYGEAAGQRNAAFMSPLMIRVAGPRVEPLTRSLRISSEELTAQTGWSPKRATFDAAWFDVSRPSVGALK